MTTRQTVDEIEARLTALTTPRRAAEQNEPSDPLTWLGAHLTTVALNDGGGLVIKVNWEAGGVEIWNVDRALNRTLAGFGRTLRHAIGDARKREWATLKARGLAP